MVRDLAGERIGTELWSALISDVDRQVYARGGWGTRVGWGRRPAVVVVDVNRDFVGEREDREPAQNPGYPFACGEWARKALGRIEEVLAEARAAAVPVCFTTGQVTDSPGAWGGKNSSSVSRSLEARRRGAELVPELGRASTEPLFEKRGPSAFFGTEIVEWLLKEAVDTLVVTGCVTSGCVRATVVDAFSWGLRVIVPAECTFDRAWAPHAINLFDIDSKYGDVVSVEEVLGAFQAVASRPSRET
jgi:maleamate amidohydrolase